MSDAMRQYMKTGMSEAEAAKKVMASEKSGNGFVSLKSTKAERVQQNKAMQPMASGAETYPWGLELRFEEQTLDKLKMTTLPEVEDELTFTIKAKVKSVSSNESAGGGKRRCVELQVTAVKL